MRIIVRSDDAKLWIPLPGGLVLHRPGSYILWRYWRKKDGNAIPYPVFRGLCRELAKARKLLGKDPLVEVRSADGDYVCIRL